MTKELKAFIGICCNTNQNYPDFTKQRKIVETALKKLEKIETTTPSVLREDISKKLQALEIIKKKNIAIKQLQMSPCLEAYCTLYRYLYHDVDFKKGLQHLMPTQEEFDLLKEVLL